MFPVFSISLSAAEVDGNIVTTAWWYENPADYTIFGDQIISRTGYDNITVQVDVELQDDVDPKQLFNFDIDFNIGSYSSVTVTKFQLLNKKSVVVDNLSVDLYGNKISVSDLQYNDHIKYIRIQLLISRPNWIVEADESYFTINGTQYTFQKGTTWEQWVNSDYNTLNLEVDNGYIYGDNVILSYNGESVKVSDYIIEQASYTLDPLGPPATTTIDFYVYFYGGTDNGTTKKYQASYGMTWVEWVASEYNVDQFSTYSVSDTIRDKLGRFIYASKFNGTNIIDPNSLVHTQDVITADHTYLAQGASSSYSLRGYNNYTFNFSVTSISSITLDELGIWESILYFLKDIPNKVSQAIGEKLELLFVPNADRLLSMIENTLGDYSSKFGVLSESVVIIDNLASAFVYTDTQDTIELPSVTVNLAGTPFSFGGYEVDVIPDGFDAIVDILKVLINITCTISFIFAMKKRFTEILR